jgi:hypothetical protein
MEHLLVLILREDLFEECDNFDSLVLVQNKFTTPLFYKKCPSQLLFGVSTLMLKAFSASRNTQQFQVSAKSCYIIAYSITRQ